MRSPLNTLRCVAPSLLLGIAACAGSGSSPTTRGAATPRPQQPPPPPARTVAVLPLQGGTGMEGLGFAIAEILARDLALVPRVRVVERARLDQITRELGLATTGRLDPATAPRAGRLLGAERLVTGTVTRAANGAAMEVGLVDVTTGQRSALYSERVSLNGVIDAQERLAERTFGSLGITLTPAERERLSKRPTRRVDALIAFGNGRRAEALGNAAQARQFYAQAVRLDPDFREAADALTPRTAAPVAAAVSAPPDRAPATRAMPVDWLDELMGRVTDRVVRPSPLPAVCPPICPALAGATSTVIVRITP